VQVIISKVAIDLLFKETARKRQVIKTDCKRNNHGLHHDARGCSFFAVAKFRCGIKFAKPAARMPQAHALRQEAEWLAPALERADGIRNCPRSILNAGNDTSSCMSPLFGQTPSIKYKV